MKACSFCMGLLLRCEWIYIVGIAMLDLGPCAAHVVSVCDSANMTLPILLLTTRCWCYDQNCILNVAICLTRS